MLHSRPPYFPVSAPDVSTAFCRKLDFDCEYRAGDSAEFAICQRDGKSIMFRRVQDPELITPVFKQGGTWDAFFWATDLQNLFREFSDEGENGMDVMSSSMKLIEFFPEVVVRPCLTLN